MFAQYFCEICNINPHEKGVAHPLDIFVEKRTLVSCYKG